MPRLTGDQWVAAATLVAAVFATAAGGISARVSFIAAQKANEIAEEESDQQAALGLLGLALQAETTHADELRRCEAVAALIKVERAARTETEVLFVDTYFNALVDAEVWPPDCQLLKERFSEDAPAPSVTTIPSDTGAPSTSFEIGQYHALIASYTANPRGCEFATADVEFFADALAGQGFDGRQVYVARTQSNIYAVTVDAGDDVTLARSLRDAIVREAQTSNRRSNAGRDSFVQGNRDWTIDSDCAVRRVIGG